jgi:hypothetical protein
MAVPGSDQVQFNMGSGKFTVNQITDPNGPPSDVLDLDLGFKITGDVTLPNWLEGSGTVTVYAHEIGGPVNKAIGHDDLTFTRPVPPAEPAAKVYPWTVTIAPNSNVLPDPQPGGSQVYNLVAVFVFIDQLTDIGSFVDLGNYMIN